MTRKFLCSALLLGSLTVSAQQAAQVDVKDAFTYSRSSLTVVPLCGLVGHDLKYANAADAHIRNWADTVNFNGKFDMNRVRVLPIVVDTASYSQAYTNPETAPKPSFMQRIYGTGEAPVCLSETINNQLNNSSIGKDLLNYWLGFDGKYFDPTLWEQRAMYNASDADVLKDRASKVKSLITNGSALMANTYVMVVGPTSLVEHIDKKGNVSYSSVSDAFVYRMVMTPEIKEFINNQYLSKPEEGQKLTKEDLEIYAKNLADYQNLKATFEPVTSVYNISGGGSGFSAANLLSSESKTEFTSDELKANAIIGALNGVLEPLERKIPAWEVVTTVYTMRPIGGKIGKKEGVKNSDRFGAYKLVEDENGELTYRQIGWVRATNIADNAFVADGESPCSNFYQLSGTGLSEGMFLKQKKDLKLSLAVSGLFNGISPALVDVDYLMFTHHTFGSMLSAGLSFGGYAGDVQLPEELNIDTNLTGTWINGTLNVTGAIHPVRWIEVAAQIGAGAEYFKFAEDTSSDDDDSSFSKRLGYFAHGGVRLGLQVWYPFQIFVRADYNYKLSEGEWYFNSKTARFDQLGFGAGVKVNF